MKIPTLGRTLTFILIYCLLAGGVLAAAVLMNTEELSAQDKLRAYHKISSRKGDLGDILSDYGRFGSAVASVGDLDGDGISELAVGAPGTLEQNGERRQGALWILFLRRNGKVKSAKRISPTAGDLNPGAESSTFFGTALASLGDLDQDGVAEVAVGAPFTSDGGPGRGAVWILFLQSDGTVKHRQKLSATAGGLRTDLADDDFFGSALANLGDMNGDGIAELAVGAPGDDDGGEDGSHGAIWILALNADGTVQREQKISATAGGFGGKLQEFDQFGQSITNVGDVNGDGVTDLAAGVLQIEQEESDAKGAIWLLFLQRNGRVKMQQEISALSGRFGPGPSNGARYGSALAGIGDRDGDGIPDLIVGAHGNREDSKTKNRGAVWILSLRRDGLVKNAVRIAAKSGSLRQELKDNDQYSWAITNLGDLNADGRLDLAIGAPGDDDGGPERGAVWLALLK